MRAVIDSLTIGERTVPPLQPGQALVRVLYFGISREDVYLYESKVSTSKLGTEFSGEIVKIEPSIDSLEVGSRVMGFISSGGAMAEYVACDTKLLAKLPHGLGLAEAASIPDMWVSAIRLLRHDAEVKKRNRIAVYNAMEPTGQALTQLAQLIGCRRVHCVTRSEAAKEELIRHLKFDTALMDEIVAHNGTQGERRTLTEIAAFDPRGLEAVIDLGSDSHVIPEMMRPHGTIAITSALAGKGTIDWELFTVKNLTLRGTNIRADRPDSNTEYLDFLTEHIIPKIVHRSVYHKVAKVYQWESIGEAFRFVARNPELLGKVVCSI